MSKYLLILSVCLLVSCKEESTSTPDDLMSQMNAVYGQIEDLVQTSCTSSDQCIATALGVKPCGGPTKYVVHSSSTNQENLDNLVEQYNELNTQYNVATNAGSNCAFVTAPPMDCISGECQAVTD